MKYIYLFSIFFIGFNCFAQQIPNSSFEQWAYNNATQSYEPIGWNTNNLGQYNDSGVYKSKLAKTGTYALGMKTNLVGNVYLKPAFAFAHFPFTAKPANMLGFFKGELALDDTIAIIVQLTKNGKELANGLYYNYQSQNNYIKFVNPLTYINNNTPDSCKISIFQLGREKDDTLTNIAFDDFSFEYFVSVDAGKIQDNLVNIFPNPAQNYLTLETELEFNKIIVYNHFGQIIEELPKQNSLEISNFAIGIYYIEMQNKQGFIVARKSFFKQ